MYKWKNAEGVTQYTQRPPTGGIDYTRIRVREDDPKKSTSKSTPSAKAKQENAEESDSYGGWRKENCKIALQNLDILENAGKISQDDGKGGNRLMTDEERKEKLNKMREQKAKYCPQDSDK